MGCKNSLARVLLCTLISLYLSFAWCAACYRSFTKQDFPKCISLSSTYALHWKVDSKNISFAIDVDEAPTGWIGLGVSEAGGMKGGDLWIIRRTSEGAWMVTDTYSEDFVEPSTDQSQDVAIVGNPVTNGNSIAAVITRKLKACDSGDLTIYPNRTTPFVWAHAPAEGYHGNTNRGTLLIELEGDNTMESNAPVTTVTFAMPNIPVPPVTTSYLCVNFKAPMAAAKQHLVAANYSIASSLVHHLILFKCSSEPPQPIGKVYDCLQKMPSECSSFTLAWAPGVQSWRAPAEAGFPLREYYALQMHYNNPSHMEGETDNTSITLGVTSKLRAQDLGVLTLTQMDITIPADQPSFQIAPAVCPGECTSKFKQPLTVVSHVLHMHSLGKSIETQRVRNGTEMVPLGEKHRWDFNFQIFEAPNPGAEMIMPGDTLITTCTYDSSKRNFTTRFGMGTDSEMCFDFVVYYPAQDVDSCLPSSPGAALCADQGKFDAWMTNLTAPSPTPATNMSTPTSPPTNTSSPGPTVSALSNQAGSSNTSMSGGPGAGGEAPSAAQMAELMRMAVAAGYVVEYDAAKYMPGAFEAYKPADGCPEFLSAAGMSAPPGGMAAPRDAATPTSPAMSSGNGGSTAQKANGAVGGVGSGVAMRLAAVLAAVVMYAASW